ncbi:MAG: SPFH domain-containing protein [Verrucomicrobiales bacterium]|nr:SPFH domain-containing protein [Verrucomicrobiales bacterium]
MSILNFLKSQAWEIIQWEENDTRDTLSFRWPDEDREIKRGAQLIVRESQMVQFVYLGQFGDTFGPGKHDLITDNIPILCRLKGWKYGFESPFKADVYYVVTRLFSGNKWGTSNPIMMRDPDFGIVRVRAFGTFDFRIVDPKVFLKEVAGTDNHFRLDEFHDTMRSRIVSVFSDAVASARIPVLDLATRYQEVGEAILPLVNPQTTTKYGIEITSFILENASVPPEVEAAIDKRSSMGAIGNLNDYVKYQMAQGLEKGEGGTGSAAAQLGIGLAMAQQLAQQFQQPPTAPPVLGAAAAAQTPTPSAGASAPNPPALPRMLAPAEVAQALGVTEADVLATLEAGDLKGKKIGTAWRVSQTALEEFLKQ